MLFSSHTLFNLQSCLRAVLALHDIFPSISPTTQHSPSWRLLLQNPLLFCLQAGQFCWIFPILETFPYIPPLQLFLPPHALPQEHLALHVPPPEGAGGSPAFGCRLMEWAQNKSRPEALTHPTDQKGCCWTGTIFASWSQPIFPVEPQHWHNVSPCPFPSP